MSQYSKHENIYEEIPKQQSISILGSLSAKGDIIESNRSSELGMEYDDVEYMLLGKLSAKDLEKAVQVDSEEDSSPLQLEGDANIELVKKQPYRSKEDDGEPVSKMTRRSSSTMNHSHHKHRRHNHKHNPHRHHHWKDEDGGGTATRREESVDRHRPQERHTERLDAPMRPHPPQLPPAPRPPTSTPPPPPPPPPPLFEHQHI